MDGGRQAECPNCGAPIAFRLASSQALVCSFCRFSVVRSDRELAARGRVADLVPTSPPLTVDDEGSVSGRAFRVLGRLQLDHGRGPWDEWYLGFSDGTWGWLARAQGRWYLTFERAAGDAPPWESLTPGQRTTLASTGSLAWVVSERGGSAVVSAEGELPFPVDPRGSGRYVDLEAEGAAFATLDYGDEVRLFVGREVDRDEVTLKQTAVGPRPVEKVTVERLRCPSCGAPVPIFVPSQTERCGCAACGALLDHTRGALALLTQLEPPPVAPQFELGSEAELFGEKRTLIGFMQRSVSVSGEVYTFREYLLHAESGYAWLVEENRHWLYVAPVAASAVRERGKSAYYNGRTHRLFARNRPRVDFVVGEFYWKVMAGDESDTADYIAPPYALSMERSENEISWSAGEYLEPTRVYRAFGSKERPLVPIGVAAAQPNPFRGRGATYVFALLSLLWFVLAFSYELGSSKTLLFEQNIALGARATPFMLPNKDAPPVGPVTTLSPPFDVTRGPTTLQLDVESPISNGTVLVEAALVPESGGEPRELAVLVEHYQGTSSDGAWSEGDHDAQGHFGRVVSGRYTLRLVSSWEPYDGGWASQSTPPPLRVRLTRGARSPGCCIATFVLLALPWLFGRLRARTFELRRNENGNA